MPMKHLTYHHRQQPMLCSPSKPDRQVKADLSQSRSVAGLAPAIITGHSTGSSSYGCFTSATGHSLRGAGKPAMNDWSGSERTGDADPKRS